MLASTYTRHKKLCLAISHLPYYESSQIANGVSFNLIQSSSKASGWVKSQ